MIVFICVSLLLRFLINLVKYIDIDNSYICVFKDTGIKIINNNIINSDNIIKYCLSNDYNENKVNENINMDKSKDENEKNKVSKNPDILESIGDKKTFIERTTENTSNEINHNKGKGKRSYELYDEETSIKKTNSKSVDESQTWNEKSKKCTENIYDKINEEPKQIDEHNYRNKADESEINYSKYEKSKCYNDYENQNEEYILQFKKPEIIEEEIKMFNKDINLIKEGKELNSHLPPSSQWMSTHVKKLSKIGYGHCFDNNETVKEGLDKAESHAEEELDSSQRELNHYKTTLEAEGSEIQTLDETETTVLIKTSKEQYDKIVSKYINPEANIEQKEGLDNCDKDKDESTINSSSLSLNSNKNFSNEISETSSKSTFSASSNNNSSENSVPTDTKAEDKKLTPGDYIDSLPQDMPGFFDEPD